jgi:16S rRNA (guanine966-N2)-methyltransferase
MSGSRNPTARHNQVRIIGGQWRGRKLNFTPADGLRPTGDRIRETLFNWLAPYINGARCADLFAGSGALGLEALSRGAAHCDFVDLSKHAIAQVVHHLDTLQAVDRATCHVCSAEQFLQHVTLAYDIVFIDPPFSQHLAEPACAALAHSHHLNEDALIYIETDAARPQPQLPSGWTLHREKRSGDVRYAVFRNEHGTTTQ